MDSSVQVQMTIYYNSHPLVPYLGNSTGITPNIDCDIYTYLSSWDRQELVTYTLVENALMLAPSFAGQEYTVEWVSPNGGSGLVDGYPQTVSSYGDMTLVTPVGSYPDLTFNFIIDGVTILSVQNLTVLYSHSSLVSR